MTQNERENEKSLRKAPENDKVRHHLLSTLTAKINNINYEVKGHKTNIKMHEDQIQILTNLIKSRETNLGQYNERKQFLLDYVFTDEPVIEDVVIVESVEPKEPPKKEKEEKPDETDLLVSLLKSKGILLGTVIKELQKD